MQAPQTEVVFRGADGTKLARAVLTPGEYVIGRHADCSLRVEADLVSRRHAQLTVNFDHLLIEDLGSANGTLINGKPITAPTRLWPNQKVQIGSATLEFHRLKAVAAPDVSLAPSTAAVQRLLPEAFLREQKYDIGGVVAQGGMGAILDAREATTERKVAMKVMLDSSSPDDLTRFIAEAKVTAQLEHPSIVPVYELSVDENDQVFYTMKFVRGITLRKVLDLMAEGAEPTLKKYPLGALLTIFQKVCDAIAFAHSRGVIHRDLKPENVMLGDFGEVLVMDWGLAKVTRNAEVGAEALRDGAGAKAGGSTDTRNEGGGEESAMEGARSMVRMVPDANASATMAGTVMGTPQYMSPEQARGEVETLDARSDLYALGAILYQLLALHPPVSGAEAWDIVKKVAAGEVEPLTAPRHGKASHLPGGRIPDSLAAVVRKAMSFEKAQRYASAEDLQADLAAFQNGFATRAENAGLGRLFLLKLKRHKTVAFASVLVLVAGFGFGAKAVVEGRRAERGEVRANQALRELRATAPDLLALAASEAALQRYESALRKTDAALALDSGLAAAYWRRGWLLLAQEKLSEALVALRFAQAKDPANRPFAAVLPLVERMVAAGAGRHAIEIVKPLCDHLSSVGALGESAPFVPHLKLGNEARRALVRERLERWLGKAPGDGRAAPSVQLSEGILLVNLNGLNVGNLDPLRGLPIDKLKLNACGLTSLEPLRGMRLEYLEAGENSIEDRVHDEIRRRRFSDRFLWHGI